MIEDGPTSSQAGAFVSLLAVDGADETGLADAIDEVASSLTDNPKDQILVQEMALDIAVSGVIMTYDMVNGAPYYCIDFDDESGRTDVVTGGNGINKGLFVYRYTDNAYIRSPRVARFLRLARELEQVSGCAALDIEFGLSRTGELLLFQVRRIALAGNWHPVTEKRAARQLIFVENFVRNRSLPHSGVLGRRTILAVMPDWNPAEIIGATPRQLASSLYRTLVTSGTWRDARAAMGYRRVPDEELMVTINNHPYIDVRNSFNSFLPADVPDATGERLVDAWMDRLEARPELHDKVEFDIVPTCLDFCFEDDMATRYPGLLNQAALDVYRTELRKLTRALFAPGSSNTLETALLESARLASHTRQDAAQAGENCLIHASTLIRICRERGAPSFAIAARHAFVAEGLLRTAVRRGALSDARLNEFKRTIRTVTSAMVEEYENVCKGLMAQMDFLNQYGHLRPGTYEITSLRYDERHDLFLDTPSGPGAVEMRKFNLKGTERQAIDMLLAEAGLDVLDASALFAYADRAIAGREYAKFNFTRCLSDALSSLVRWGAHHGLSRDDLSFIDWPSIERSLIQPEMDEVDRHYLDLADANRRSIAAAHAFRLGHIIFGVADIYAATINRSVPNFIGTGAATGRVVELTANTSATVNIRGHIVCIDNADPGFDWIFTRQPLALITKFGGANSHMAIRCAEFGLPAAIGCGDQIYARCAAAAHVELNCPQRILRPIHAK
jgi:glutamine kinase